MRRVIASALIGWMCVGSCARRLERTLHEPGDVGTAANKRDEYRVLKAHMLNGDLYVLEAWQVAADGSSVTGRGIRYDMHRAQIAQGQLQVAITEVALFETNSEVSEFLAGMTVVTGLSALVTAACAVNPKSCFGSCPTFYAFDGDDQRILAEGFSEAISPVWEQTDIDALFEARPMTRDLDIRVTNEALETHVIRQANILVAPRPPGGRVFATTDGRFVGADRITAARACSAAEGDCTDAVAAVDQTERFSRTDGRNLASRELIELTFDVPEGERLGLVIQARQTLLTTFLLYQALAYLGSEAVATLARLQRGDPELLDKVQNMSDILGGIEVQIPDGPGQWHTVGSFHETGPIASDHQLVALPEGRDLRRIRLRLTRGHWRLGRIAMARVIGEVEPTRLAPIEVRTSDRPAPALAERLGDPDRAIVTLPGDSHTLRYRLPADPASLELFLEARGYYLEWMREEWMKEENSVAAAAMLYTPHLMLRWLAPAFHEAEPDMDRAFWNSRYGRD